MIMAELPGWDRDRLRTADPADVMAARWIVYGRSWAEFLGIPFSERIREAELDGLKGPRREAAMNAINRDRLRNLKKGMKHQAQVRQLLELDVDDDDEATDG